MHLNIGKIKITQDIEHDCPLMGRRKDTRSPLNGSVWLSQFALAKEFTAETFYSISTTNVPGDEAQEDHRMKATATATEAPQTCITFKHCTLREVDKGEAAVTCLNTKQNHIFKYSSSCISANRFSLVANPCAEVAVSFLKLTKISALTFNKWLTHYSLLVIYVPPVSTCRNSTFCPECISVCRTDIVLTYWFL